MDYLYFKSISRFLDLEGYGYDNTLVIFENKTFLIGAILFFSFIGSALFMHFYKKEKEKNIEYLDQLKEKMEKISKGDYSITIDEINSLGVVYDELYKLVLELRESKELATKDKIKLKENLEDISHQLKTPISSIEIMLELSKSTGEDYTEKIESEVLKIEHLISSMLTLAKFDANQIDFKSEEFLISEALSVAVESLETLSKENSVEVFMDVEDFKITGDFYWTVEALINIIKNSIEYSKKSVNITAKRTKLFGEVEIKDDGEGFSTVDLRRLFHRFYKSEKSKNGVGIGLNLSKKILENHNATISAENDNGGKFIIKFYS